MFSGQPTYTLLTQHARNHLTYRALRNTLLIVATLLIYTAAVVLLTYSDSTPSYSSPLIDPNYACHDTPSCLKRPANISFSPLSLPARNETPTARKYAFVSALYTNTYLRAALTLGHSLGKHHPTQNYPMYLLHFSTTSLSKLERCQLASAGWTLVQISPIPAPPSTPPHFITNYAKFHIWSLVSLDAVIYLDADTLVLHPIDPLFNLVDPTLSPFEFAAGPDNWGGLSLDFNAGILALHPSAPVYAELLRLYNRTDAYPPQFAEQSFLNEFWRLRTLRLPDLWNMNVAFWERHQLAWEKVWQDVRVVHFTVVKPMVGGREKRCMEKRWMDLCALWDRAWRDTEIALNDGCRSLEV